MKKATAIKGLGETVLRLRDLRSMKAFYSDVIRLNVTREFDQDKTNRHHA
ncbi:MAG: hypothetical protein ACE5K1_10880 [Acidiferrobacterales bacterium]